MFAIDDNVPAPRPRSKGYTDAIRQLMVGQSVALPISKSVANSLLNKMALRAERERGSLTARTEGDGCRVWRIR